ncbi:MAG: sodium:proton antiporter [Clostridia bacterium]|nr:sodium:proton antiporter [Clostridia bacterium]
MYMEWIRFIAGSFFFIAGLIIFVIEIFGNFRFGYVLNRMHAASIGDSFGIILCLVGLMIFSGISFLTLKLGSVAVFLWFSTPVCTHLIAKLEMETNEEIEKECEVEEGCRF